MFFRRASSAPGGQGRNGRPARPCHVHPGLDDFVASVFVKRPGFVFAGLSVRPVALRSRGRGVAPASLPRVRTETSDSASAAPGGGRHVKCRADRTGVNKSIPRPSGRSRLSLTQSSVLYPDGFAPVAGLGSKPPRPFPPARALAICANRQECMFAFCFLRVNRKLPRGAGVYIRSQAGSKRSGAKSGAYRRVE
jgi:hypothetical protein